MNHNRGVNELDLSHGDWALLTQEKLIQQTDTNVSITYIVQSNGTTNMSVSGIKPINIAKFKFLTNTNDNNNYVYLTQFNIYINNGFNPLVVPGLSDVVKTLFRNSDLTGYLNDSKTNQPFSDANVQSGQNLAKTFNEFVSLGLTLIPYVPHLTVPQIIATATYEVILTADLPHGDGNK